MIRLQDLYVRWDEFLKVPTVRAGKNVDKIEVSFGQFPAGTDREEIWQWFEGANKRFDVSAVMDGKRVAVGSPEDKADRAECAAGDLLAVRRSAPISGETALVYPETATKAVAMIDSAIAAGEPLAQYVTPDELHEWAIRSPDVALHLLKNGVAPADGKASCLPAAILKQRLDLLDALLDAGADVDGCDADRNRRDGVNTLEWWIRVGPSQTRWNEQTEQFLAAASERLSAHRAASSRPAMAPRG